MNLPEEFWRVKVQEVPESVRPMVERYLKSFPEMRDRGAGLILGGTTPGAGRTGTAALILKHARSLLYSTHFATVWELRECVRNKIMWDEAMTVLDRCRDVDVLVLDGLKPEDEKEPFFGVRAMEELLASRCSRKRVTIITTRMSAQEFGAKMRSLADCVQGRLLFVSVDGPNKRSSQSEELKKAILGTG
jgi:DNA replication protein DnaC